MAKHKKFDRDLEKLDKPALHKARAEILRKFMTDPDDEIKDVKALEKLDAIEDLLDS